MKRLILLAYLISCYTFNLSAQQCNDTLPVTETFDSSSVIGVCWDLMDQDGDSYSWSWWEFSPQYGGHKVIASYSFDTLTPDNWIISHAIDLTSFNSGDNITLSWKIRGELDYAAHEYYSVYAALSNEATDFESSSVQRSEYTDEVGGAGVFVTRNIDVSSLAGNIIYIAFRHHKTSNQGAINIDEISISSSLLGVDDLETDSFKHYYNKDTDHLTLKSKNVLNGIQLYSLLGQQVLYKNISNSEENIDLSYLKDGIYIGKVTIDNRMHSFKFIKQ